jgi:hypothetical protein
LVWFDETNRPEPRWCANYSTSTTAVRASPRMLLPVAAQDTSVPGTKVTVQIPQSREVRH